MRKVFALFGTISMTGVEKITAQLSGIDKKLAEASTQISKAGRTMATVGKNLSLHLTAPIAAAGGAIVKFGADFDKSMQTSIAIMKDVDSNMREKLAEGAREVAKTTTFSAKEAAEAYYFLASAGLKAEESLAMLPKVAKFAEAGQFDLRTATDLLTDALTAMGMAEGSTAEKTENLVRLSDVLIGATTDANATTQQFAEALTNKSANAFRLVGKSVEEAVSVLMVFADQGIKGVDGGTALSIVMRDLTSKAIKNTDAFKKFNVSVFDSDGKMRKMHEIVQNLEKALDGMSDKQKKATIMQMGFTDKSSAALMALIGYGQKLEENYVKTQNYGDITEHVAETQLQTFWAQLELVKSQFIDIAIELSNDLLPIIQNKLLPFVREAISMFKQWVDVFRKLPIEIKETTVFIMAMTATFGPLLFAGGKVLIFLGSLRKSILGIKTILAAMAGPAGVIAAVGLALAAVGVTVAHFKREYDDLIYVHNTSLVVLTKEEAQREKQIAAMEQEIKVYRNYANELDKNSDLRNALIVNVDRLLMSEEKLQKFMGKSLHEKVEGLNDWVSAQKNIINLGAEAFKQQEKSIEQTKIRKKTIEEMTDAEIEAETERVDAEIKALDEGLAYIEKTESDKRKKFIDGEVLIQKTLEERRKNQYITDQENRDKRQKDDADKMAEYRKKAFEIEAEENKKGVKEYNEARKKELEKKVAVISFIGSAAEQMGNIMGSLYDRQQVKLDENYEKDKERIENSIMDEEEKKQALIDLENKYNEDSNKIKKKQAITDKAMALFQIAINTAVAISEVLGQPWLIAGIVALGAAQAAAVALEPIPLKKGGFLPGSEYGTMALLGEQGTKELVLPLETGIKQLTSGIVDQIGLMVNPNTNQPKESLQGNINSNSQLVLNIGTFYGEEQWVKELTRKIIPVINSENQRKALSF